jgi:predicted nucleotidyltransferase
MDRPALIEATRDVLEARQEPVLAVYMFGSTARGTDRAGSDLDLALLYPDGSRTELARQGFAVAFDLELRLKRPVDVVILNEASADLAHRVLRDGILVLERDHRARVDFEVRSRAHYLDLIPLRNAYRRLAIGDTGERAGDLP